MKVLILARSSGPSFINRGWENVLTACGHTVRYWHGEREPAFDVFNAFEPDVLISTTWNVDAALTKCLTARKGRVRVGLYASTWGDLADRVDLQKYPVVAAGPAEKDAVARLKDLTGEPSFVWLHLTPSYVEPVIGGWRRLGIPPLGLTNAADAYTYAKGKYRPEFASDVAWVGGVWPYKLQNVGPYFLPLCHPDHPARLRVRVWGNTTWPTPSYCGSISPENEPDVYASARVTPSLGEPHSHLYWSDIVERVYKAPLAGGCVVTGPELGVEEEFGPGVIPQGRTPEEFRSLIVKLARDPDERERVAARQRDVVWAGHCYHHRVAKAFGEGFGLPGEAEKVMADHGRLARGYGRC